jgi:hypothetical protein
MLILLRRGRIARPVAARRLVLRISRSRLVLRERVSRTTTRNLVRAVSVPVKTRVQSVRVLHGHTVSRLPAEPPRTAPAATALQPPDRPVTRMVVRETRRIDRLHLQTVRERTRVAHAPDRSRACVRSDQRPTRAVARLGPPAPAADLAPPAAATSAPLSVVAAADPVPPTPAPAEPSRSPSVEEIAERVLRLIERRARAQRERLGRL